MAQLQESDFFHHVMGYMFPNQVDEDELVVTITSLTKKDPKHAIADDTFILMNDGNQTFKIGETYAINRSDRSKPIVFGAFTKEKVLPNNYRFVSFFGRIGHITDKKCVISKKDGITEKHGIIVCEGISTAYSASTEKSYYYFGQDTKCVSSDTEYDSDYITLAPNEGKKVIASLKVGDLVIYHRKNPTKFETEPSKPPYEHIYWYPLEEEGDGYLAAYMFLKKYGDLEAKFMFKDLHLVLNRISTKPNNFWRQCVQKLFDPTFTSPQLEKFFPEQPPQGALSLKGALRAGVEEVTGDWADVPNNFINDDDYWTDIVVQ